MLKPGASPIPEASSTLSIPPAVDRPLSWMNEVKKLKQEKSLLQTKVEELEQKSMKQKADLDYYWCKSIQVDEKRKEKEAELAEKESQLNRAHKTIAEKTQEFDLQAKQLKDVQDQLVNKTANESRLERQVSQNEDRIERLRGEISRLDRERSSKNINSKLNRIESERDSLRERLRKKSVVERNLQRQISANRKTIDTMSAQIEELISDHEKSLHEKKLLIEELQDKVKKEKESLSTANSELDHRAELILGLGEVIREQTQTLDNFTQKNAKLEEKINIFMEEQNNVKNAVENLCVNCKMKVSDSVNVLRLLENITELECVSKSEKIADQCYSKLNQINLDKSEVTQPKEEDSKPSVISSAGCSTHECSTPQVPVAQINEVSLPNKREVPDPEEDLEEGEIPSKKLKVHIPVAIGSSSNVSTVVSIVPVTDSSDEDVDIIN